MLISWPFSFSPPQSANYYGSLLESSTVSIGSGPKGEIFVPFRELLPMVHPNDIVFDGNAGAPELRLPKMYIKFVHGCRNQHMSDF